MASFDIKTILVPVDFSACSERAFTLALGLAERFQAQVVALHAVYLPTPTYAGETSIDYGRLATQAAGSAEEALHDFLRRLDAPESVRAVNRVGEPVQTILDEAKAVSADVIVMGTHGRKGLQRLFLGSVTDRVLRTSPIPVLSCRTKQSASWTFGDEEASGAPV